MRLYHRLKDDIDFGFDPDALEERYRAERDKRLRTDYDEQFVSVDLDSRSEHLVDDPYTPMEKRDPVDEEVEFLVVGGGWVGLMTAARLKEAGHEDLRIIEGAGDFGGVWYWNRYPGAQCDVQSYVYLPLLEETGYMPKERYAHAPEIFEHAQRIGRHFGLYENTVFHTWIKKMRWDEDVARWIVHTNRGDVYRARYVSVSTGSASRPKLPGIPGIDTFEGKIFHTSRWDFEYTGGDATGGLTGLEGKRVGVIGTGATGVQVIPHVAAWADETFVFQRTPSPVGPRGNAPTDPEWVKGLEPGWQAALLREFDRVAAGGIAESPVLKTESMLNVRVITSGLLEHLEKAELTDYDDTEVAELAGHMTMDALRKRVDEEVTRPEHAALLKPWYGFRCKRPTSSDDYLAAFNRPNVTLVDVSASKGVEAITPRGVVANGVEQELDCLILASGFEITSDFDRRVGIPIFGLEGRSLYDHWRDGMRTMHGIMAHGFPNLFVLGGLFTQSLSPNYNTPVDSQARHVVHVVDSLAARGARAAQPSRSGEAEFIADQLEGEPSPFAIMFGGSPETCTPGYYTQEGKPVAERRQIRLEGYQRGGESYWTLMEAWRGAGDLAGLEVR